MRNLLSFKDENEEGFASCPCRESIREILWQFHRNLLNHCAMPASIEDKSETPEHEEVEPPSPSVRYYIFILDY